VRLIVALTAAFLAAVSASAQSEREVERPGVLLTDSRAPYVHRISLYDRDGEVISPDDGRPYATTATCGKCHPVGRIAHGWHFNAGETGIDPGRPGEPWVYTDVATGTQLPISARGWPGTLTPQQVGLSDWQFVLRFGHHMPGGGLGAPELARDTADTAEAPVVGENTADTAVPPGELVRWEISGTLEIDCLICHSADQRHDPAEQARQIEKQNFKWSPIAALGLGVVRGEARKLPDDFDPFMGANPDRPDQVPPSVTYDKSRFDPDDRVFFNVTRRPSPNRCYFCHSFRTIRQSSPGQSTSDEHEPAHTNGDIDVHLTSGMICVDCHRNGIDHRISRGYDGDPAAVTDSAPLTCRGCHLGSAPPQLGRDAYAGRGGAPYPLHKGIPPVHFEKLTCTTCHSGPWPSDSAVRFQTAMNHGLGLPTRTRSERDAPTILGPIFARQPDGRIAPHRMLWPAFWGVLEGGAIKPLPIETVERAAAKPAKRDKRREHDPMSPLSDEDIRMLFKQLGGQVSGGVSLVYVCDGLVHSLNEDGHLVARPHEDARPYLWPIAHDVRPASQALGARGCSDCHAPDAPIYFGSVAARDEPSTDDRPIQKMNELLGGDTTPAMLLGLGFRMRTAFKCFGAICAALIAIVLLRHGFAGVVRATPRGGE